MGSEDELPKELDKLEITHVLPQIKLLDSNLPVQFNPFFENDLKDSNPAITIEQTTTITTKPFSITNRTTSQYCRSCRFRRSSESTLEEIKDTATSNPLTDSVKRTRTLPSGLLKKVLKKNLCSPAGSLGNRKVLLREPILKALQTCLHPHSNIRRKLLSSTVVTKATAGSDSSLTTKGMSGFRDLIDECRNLLSEDVDFSGRLNQLCLSNQNSKNFTTMQTSKIQSTNKLRNNTASSLPSPDETAALNVDHISAEGVSLIQPSLLVSTSSTLIQQSNMSSLLPEQVPNPARCNTTCSQQAGSSAAATACDDVNIDELASYFDTFVHIPKKMSSMAEMMYI